MSHRIPPFVPNRRRHMINTRWRAPPGAPGSYLSILRLYIVEGGSPEAIRARASRLRLTPLPTTVSISPGCVPLDWVPPSGYLSRYPLSFYLSLGTYLDKPIRLE